MNNKKIFPEKKINKTTIKYFIIAFSIFIVLLAVGSVAILMYSLDFDLGNLVENTTEAESDISNEQTSDIYSVNDLTGKSSILFLVKDQENSLDYFCVISTDYDNKSMTVNCYAGNEKMLYNGKTVTAKDVYSEDFELGIKKSLLETENIDINKYVAFTDEQLNDVLCLFDGFSVNVESQIDYKSSDFNLSLDAGRQELSGDLTFKYIKISNNSVRERILCDIINSVLVPNYTENSQKLFTSFVNLCKTDISVIDYSNEIDKIKAYSYAEDKFLPKVYVEGDAQ